MFFEVSRVSRCCWGYFVSGCAHSAKVGAEGQERNAAQPQLVFLTDFGTANDAVAICKVVMYQVVPNLQVRDVSHQMRPFSIEEGARFFYGVTPYYPGARCLSVWWTPV